MKIGIIIPDRNDRPMFLEKTLYMIGYQTKRPNHIEIVNYPAESNQPDITQRYRRGYEKMNELNVDLIFFIENDDWYSPDYINYMLMSWKNADRPDLFGTSFTTYYHIGLRKYFKFRHPERASMMNTIIKPGLDINWPPDHESFTDMFLWTRQDCFNGSKSVWSPKDSLSIGIKHGIGLCGGRQHTTGLHRYTITGGLGNEEASGNDDANANWLAERVQDKLMLDFYKSFYNK